MKILSHKATDSLNLKRLEVKKHCGHCLCRNISDIFVTLFFRLSKRIFLVFKLLQYYLRYYLMSWMHEYGVDGRLLLAIRPLYC